MIVSNTQFMGSSSDDDEIEDLDARIAKYSNIKTNQIGDFTDSESDRDDNKVSMMDHDDDTDESESEEDEDSEIASGAQDSFNVSVRVRPLFSKEKIYSLKVLINNY